MQTITINPEELRVGSKLLSVKTQQTFKVDSINSKITIDNEEGEIKVLSLSTLKRWYKLIVEDAADEVEPEVVEPVATVHPAYVEALEPVVEEEPTEEPEEEVAVEEEPVVEEVAPPVQPAIPQPAVRRAPNAQPSDPVIEALRQRIIDEVLSVCPNSAIKETSSYTGLKVGKYNFAEVYKGKKRFTIRVMSKALTPEQVLLCAIAPSSYGWTLDATFTVLVEDDFNTAVELLKSSYAYRFNNTPQRGKKSQ